MKRSKGYGSDLDRIEVAASPTGVLMTEDQRRHSIVIQVFKLFVYIFALCLHFFSLFTILLFVYISSVCLHLIMFVYNSSIGYAQMVGRTKTVVCYRILLMESISQMGSPTDIIQELSTFSLHTVSVRDLAASSNHYCIVARIIHQLRQKSMPIDLQISLKTT